MSQPSSRTSQPTLPVPPFTLDCGDWIVAETPTETTAEPVLAELSTLLFGEDACELVEAAGTLSLCLLDAGDDLADLHARPVAPGAVAQELLDHDPEPGVRRFVMPAPALDSSGARLALLAEFEVPAQAALHNRVDALMASFAWADAA